MTIHNIRATPFFFYFLIDLIPLVQTVSLHQILLLLTAQQEHFEFTDSDEFNVNIITCSSIKLLISQVSSIYDTKKRFFFFFVTLFPWRISCFTTYQEHV